MLYSDFAFSQPDFHGMLFLGMAVVSFIGIFLTPLLFGAVYKKPMGDDDDFWSLPVWVKLLLTVSMGAWGISIIMLIIRTFMVMFPILTLVGCGGVLLLMLLACLYLGQEIAWMFVNFFNIHRYDVGKTRLWLMWPQIICGTRYVFWGWCVVSWIVSVLWGR